jgi:phosphatidylserine/phosphatidylglycerophosphate/cardiolipin synthase-like enzyme
MPYKLLSATNALIRAYQGAYAPVTMGEAVCPDRPYQKLTDISTIPVVNGEFIAFSTPDSAFFVTRNRIEAAQRSILIGIYDFTANHMRDLLIAAVQRGISVTLMLDCNFKNLPSTVSAEKSIFEDLAQKGVRCVRAPSCQGGTNRFFKVAHEKVMVIDDLWTLVQSGNYSNSSIPFNQSDGVNSADFKTGNRDMGIAIKSSEVASFFSRIINGDIQLELAEEDEVSDSALVATSLPPLFERAVEAVPFQLFPSQPFPTPGLTLGTVPVLPVLTPENYMDVVLPLLESARRSIIIEQQYIRNFNLSSNGSIKRLVMAITHALEQNPDLVVSIIVAPPYSDSADDRNKLRNELDALAGVGLLEGKNVRLLNKDHLKHCHNKLIIVDEEKVLISSQNWSEPAVTINREAGVLITQSDIAGYFARIFNEDWDNAYQSLADAPDTELFMLDDPSPQNVQEILASGDFAPVEWGDHADV